MLCIHTCGHSTRQSRPCSSFSRRDSFWCRLFSGTRLPTVTTPQHVSLPMPHCCINDKHQGNQFQQYYTHMHVILASWTVVHTLDSSKAIPLKVVVVGELFTSFAAAFRKNPNTGSTSHDPLLCTAVWVARVVQVPSPVALLCCIYQQPPACENIERSTRLYSIDSS